ncbi:MAG: NAD/NADP octopine/nopaline dehydrogenase family protein [Promethearchaeota archaeon]
MINSSLNITVIGAGNGGRAFSVYLSRLGHNVTLVYRTLRYVENIKFNKRIISYGKITGSYKLKEITNNYKKAIENADIILYVIPAFAHYSVTKEILPYLKSNQIIILNPGRTWGAIEVYNLIKNMRPKLHIHVGEAQTLLFTCRKIKDFGVSILKIKNSVDFCFYPEKENDILYPIINSIFPQFNLVNDIRETSLNNMGAVIHPAVTVMNTGSITRQSQFLFYSDGISKNIANLIEKLDRERCKILKYIGVKPITLIDWANKAYDCNATNYYQVFHQIESYQNIKAPMDLRIRYLTEDVPTGLVPLSSIAKYLSISSPIINSVIVIANTLLNTDFYKKGRTIENNPILKSLLIRKWVKKRAPFSRIFLQTRNPIAYDNFE